jgi:8-oxo-dGTP diphosphatase
MNEIKLGLKKCAVLCILRCRDKLLLLHRTKEPHKGKYIPIGGRLEPFETPIEAAKREIKEETGFNVKDLKFCGIMVETSPVKFNWVNFIYLGNINFSKPVSCKEGRLEWIKISNILNIPTPTTDRYIYQYILKNKNFMFNAIYNKKIELLTLHEEIEDKILYKK